MSQGDFDWMTGGQRNYGVSNRPQDYMNAAANDYNQLNNAQNASQQFGMANQLTNMTMPSETPFLHRPVTNSKLVKPRNWVRKCAHCGNVATERRCESCGAADSGIR